MRDINAGYVQTANDIPRANDYINRLRADLEKARADLDASVLLLRETTTMFADAFCGWHDEMMATADGFEIPEYWRGVRAQVELNEDLLTRLEA